MMIQNYELLNLMFRELPHHLKLRFGELKGLAYIHPIMNTGFIEYFDELLTYFVKNNMVVFDADNMTDACLTKEFASRLGMTTGD